MAAAILALAIEAEWRKRAAGVVPAQPKARPEGQRHILFYEQASYAIQDTPDMVAHHYGRFLPQDKAALAARILNQVWEAA